MTLIFAALFIILLHAAVTAIWGGKGMCWTIGVAAAFFAVWVLSILAGGGSEPAMVGAASLLQVGSGLGLIMAAVVAYFWMMLVLTGALIGIAIRQFRQRGKAWTGAACGPE